MRCGRAGIPLSCGIRDASPVGLLSSVLVAVVREYIRLRAVFIVLACRPRSAKIR